MFTAHVRVSTNDKKFPVPMGENLPPGEAGCPRDMRTPWATHFLLILKLPKGLSDCNQAVPVNDMETGMLGNSTDLTGL